MTEVTEYNSKSGLLRTCTADKREKMLEVRKRVEMLKLSSKCEVMRSL